MLVQSRDLDSRLEPFHAIDNVPASSLLTNEKLTNGAYKVAPNMRALEAHFAPKTMGIFLGNENYAAVFAEGEMGARAVRSQCARNGVALTGASEAVYNLFDTTAVQAEFTASGTFGVQFLKGGEQLVSLGPSLGSTLAGPTSGGGHDAVVSATNTANIFRALAGAPPLNVLESPLLALTTGQGRTAAELARLAETVGARGAAGWKHSTQIGGVASHVPRLAPRTAPALLRTPLRPLAPRPLDPSAPLHQRPNLALFRCFNPEAG